MLNDRNMENKHNQMFYPERASKQAFVCSSFQLRQPTHTWFDQQTVRHEPSIQFDTETNNWYVNYASEEYSTLVTYELRQLMNLVEVSRKY